MEGYPPFSSNGKHPPAGAKFRRKVEDNFSQERPATTPTRETQSPRAKQRREMVELSTGGAGRDDILKTKIERELSHLPLVSLTAFFGIFGASGIEPGWGGT
ncbi:hypothetical protein Nepgr_006815 [Nepenthes gracilis]|uniref:Uncharacterized protein n=1 Tax=Nepenthes gracilis TaxID=150966 RepID=A0AAD3S5T8_NEPGR|nr:hypothetical protein Nepgr_006815 [Nepenthes gracilis]